MTTVTPTKGGQSAINPDVEGDAEFGHFDQWTGLRPLLKQHNTSLPPSVSTEEYSQWTAARREAFDEERINRIASHIVIDIPRLAEFRREVSRAAYLTRRPIGRTGVFLSGPATAGKTTASFFALLDAYRAHARRYPDWEKCDHIPVVYIEVPSNSTAKSIMGRFLNYFGIPFADRLTLEERTQLVINQLMNRRTSLVVIDEVHNLRMNRGHFESAQAIKGLMNAVKVVPVYVGMNLDKTVMTTGDLGNQFAGRSTMITMGPLGIRTTAERELWRGVIYGFEEQLGLFNHPPRTLFPHAVALWHQTRGSIGTLSKLLTSAAIELVLARDPHGERITPELLATFKVDLKAQRELDRAADLAKKGKGIKNAP